MENDVRGELADDFLNSRLIPDIPKQGLAWQTGIAFADFQIYLIEQIFRGVEHSDLGWRKAGNLTRQLATDGPAGAGDQYLATGDQPLYRGQIEHRLAASQYILDVDRPWRQRSGSVVSVIQRGQTRNACHREAESNGGGADLAHHRAIDLSSGNQDALRSQVFVPQTGGNF